MSKYGPGLTLNSVCKLELEELNDILNKYNVTDEDKKEIRGMVTEGYFQAHQLAKGARVLERLLEENGVKIDFKKYIELDFEEGKKYNFDAGDEDE